MENTLQTCPMCFLSIGVQPYPIVLPTVYKLTNSDLYSLLWKKNGQHIGYGHAE